MSENDTYTQPDYAGDPDDTLVIVRNSDPLDETVRGGATHDDARDYAQLMSDLAEERKERVQAQEERDKYKRLAELTAKICLHILPMIGAVRGEIDELQTIYSHGGNTP